MRMLVLVTSLGMLLASTLGVSAGPLVNGSFEDPVLPNDGRFDYTVPTGWTVYTDQTCNPQMLRYTSGTVPVPDGVQYAQIQTLASTAGTYAGFYQTFDVTPGQLYIISGWFRPLSGTSIARVGVDLNGGTQRPTEWGAVLDGAISQTWTEFSFEVTAVGPSMTIFLDHTQNGTKSGRATAFDGIKVVVPEPASLGTLLAGTVGLVGLRTRRRK
ncbi:MAG: PEP-CTERM sorting domain-containing protein [Armatimonadota bacterium]|nr:PEP-CTERM sorting domain-containing protein [Armatimonadota bacterium]